MKKIFLVLLIFLVTVSASFALSDNLTVEDAISDDLNLTNDTSIDNVSKDVNSDSKKTVFDFSSLLYEDYLNGFEGFVANLDDVEYAMYFNKNAHIIDGDFIKYNQSENFKDFDILLFSYKNTPSYKDTYAFHTSSDLIDLDNSNLIPAYIVGDSIYVGQPKEDDNVTFKGYISLLNDVAHRVTEGEDVPINSSNDNTTSFLDDQSPVLNQNDTGNVAENSSEVSKHNSVLETGGPVVALLVSLLVSIVGFRRKD